MSDNNENEQVNDSIQNNIQNDTQSIIESQESNKPNKKSKHIVISVIVAVIVFCLTYTIINSLKSDTENVFLAYNNSLDKYLYSDSNKTFFNQLLDIKKSNSAKENPKFNFETSIIFNKIKDIVYLNGSKFNLNMNTDRENQECGVNFNGVFNNIEIPDIQMYLNTDECIFDVPSIAPDKSFYVSFDDLIKNSYLGDDFDLKEFFEYSKSSDIEQINSLLLNEINDELIKKINMKPAEPTVFNGHSLDTYKCVLNNEEAKSILKDILSKIVNNEYFKKLIETNLKMLNGNSYSYDDFKKNFDDKINSDFDLNIDNITILAAIDGKDLINLKIDINESEKSSYVFEMKFSGEKEPSDNFDCSFIYNQNGNEIFNIVFTDTTVYSDGNINNSKTLRMSDSSTNKLEVQNLITLETTYNNSSNDFSGKLTVVDGKLPSTVDFNGTIKSDGDLLDLDFKNILLKKGTETLADISFSLKTGEFKGIKKPQKDNVINISENPMEFLNLLQNFV